MSIWYLETFVPVPWILSKRDCQRKYQAMFPEASYVEEVAGSIAFGWRGRRLLSMLKERQFGQTRIEAGKGLLLDVQDQE